MKKLLLSLMTPTTQSSRLADAILAIPRIFCGFFLAYNFGGSKFGLDYWLTKRWRKKMMIISPSEIPSLNTTVAYKALGVLCLFSSGVCVASPGPAEYQITFEVDMNQCDGVETVALRGNVEPLSWEEDYPLTDENGDGIYEATITFNTKKRRVAYKYLQNGEWELDGLDNRKYSLTTNRQTISNVYNEYDFYSEEEIQQLTFDAAAIKEDITTLRRTLEFIHPNLYKYRTASELNADFRELEEAMLAEPTLTNAYKSISRFATNIHCSHTFTNPWNQGSDVKRALYFQPDKIPFTFSRIGLQLFIDKNASEDERLERGLEILSINGIPTTEVLSLLAKYVTSDGNNFEKRLQRLTLNGMDKFELFDIFFPLEFGSQNTFELELKNHITGDIFSRKVKAQTITQRRSILKKRYSGLVVDISKAWDLTFLNEETAYLRMLTFAIFDNSFDWKTFVDKVFSQLNSNSIKHFIIDIRGNEGGNTEIVEYVIERLLKETITVSSGVSYTAYRKIPEELKAHISTWDKQPYDWKNKVKPMGNGKFATKTDGKKRYKPKEDGFKGQAYLLTDAANSSATHLMATYIKQYKLATIVGQPTGGNQRGLSGGYMFFHRLPNTGVEIDIPVLGINPFPVTTDTPDGGIQPDVLVEQKVADFVNGTDTVLEAVMKIIKK